MERGGRFKAAPGRQFREPPGVGNVLGLGRGGGEHETGGRRVSAIIGLSAVSMAALALAVLAGPALAADPSRAGGPSLESRIGRLESEMRAMRAEMRATLDLLSESSANIAPAAGRNQLGQVGSGQVGSDEGGVSLTVSGQVNRGLLYIDDGRGRHLFQVDNDNSSTRVRFEAAASLDADIAVGARVEVQFESNSTASVNQLDNSGLGPNNFTGRKLELWLDHSRLGRLTLGRGNTASFLTASSDLSRTKVVGGARVENMAGGILFARKTIAPGSGDVAVSRASPTIRQAFDSLNGLGRDDRVRYDTPAWRGVALSASHTAAGESDAALRQAGKFGSVRVATALGFAHAPGAFNQVSASASALHESGLNATVAASIRARVNREDADFWYLKLGYLFHPFSFGATALAVDYEENSDILQAGDSGRAMGAFAVQFIDPIAAEIYLGARLFAYGQKQTTFDDILAVLAGMRVKF